jgi:hypothetical protein
MQIKGSAVINAPVLNFYITDEENHKNLCHSMYISRP